LAWTADYNDASNFLDIFRTNSVNNDMSYRNPSVDAVLDQAGQTADRGKRRAILETVEQAILADYPIIPLYFLVSKRLVKPYVLGVQPNPLNRIASKTLVLSPH
jgi:oligopeptide transport system substrate-binding protein